MHYKCYVQSGMFHPQYFVRSHRYSVACATGSLMESTTYAKLKRDTIREYRLSACKDEEDYEYEDLEEKQRAIPLKDLKDKNHLANGTRDTWLGLLGLDALEAGDLDAGAPPGSLIVHLEGGVVMRVHKSGGSMTKSPPKKVSKYAFALSARLP